MLAANAQALIAFDEILFATDLSHAAEPAVPYVIEMASLYGSTVRAVHVKTGEWDPLQDLELARLREQLRNVRHSVRIATGDVQATLLDLVGKKAAGLIVLGTHGRTGFGRVLLGSVAETIFRQAYCPVMTVGPQQRRVSQTPLIKEILYATDLTPASAAAARYAISLAEKSRARLTILTVLPAPKTSDAAQSGHHITMTLRRLEALVPPDAQLHCQPYCIVEQGEPAEKILESAYKYNADMIVLGIRPHLVGMATHVSRRTAHCVVAGAPCPVLTVRGFQPGSELEWGAQEMAPDVAEVLLKPIPAT